METIDIIMSTPLWQGVHHRLKEPTAFTAPVFLLAGNATAPFRRKLLGREILPAQPDGRQRATSRCKEEGWHLIEVRFQPMPSEEEKLLLPSDDSETPFLYALLMVGDEYLTGTVIDQATNTTFSVRQVILVGKPQTHEPPLRFLPATNRTQEATVPSIPVRYQRQELIVGKEGQARLHEITVAIVGVSGLGSFIALELAHLGTGHLILIDPQAVEETNLNRLLGATRNDIGQKKVAVLAKRIEEIWEGATKVTSLPFALLDEEALACVKGADILLGCVDNFGARRVLNQLAVRYLIPLIDGGSGVQRATETTSLTIGGQVQLVLPGIGCLECRGFIDPDKASFDLATPEEQTQQRLLGYGTGEEAPSVISLNGVIASLQVTEVLLLLSSVSTMHNLLPNSYYDALARNLERSIPVGREGCPTCGKDGMWAVGDLAPLQPASTDFSLDPLPESFFGGA